MSPLWSRVATVHFTTTPTNLVLHYNGFIAVLILSVPAEWHHQTSECPSPTVALYPSQPLVTVYQLDKWIHVCTEMNNKPKYKTGEYGNRKWNPLSYHQLATFIKPMGKEWMEENAKWQHKTPSIWLLKLIILKVLSNILTRKYREKIKWTAIFLFCLLH